MKPTPRKIKQELKKLREFIDNHQTDSVEQIIQARFAYCVEEAIRWVTENTVGWSNPLQQAKDAATCLSMDVDHAKPDIIKRLDALSTREVK